MIALLYKQKSFEPIIQVVDSVNELYSSKFQVPGPGALVEGAGDLTLSTASRESSHSLIASGRCTRTVSGGV